MILPGSGNDLTHLSIAIKPVTGTARNIDLDLHYTAVDPAFQCYIGGIITPCALLPATT